MPRIPIKLLYYLTLNIDLVFCRYYLSAILKDYDVKGVSVIGESDSLQVRMLHTTLKTAGLSLTVPLNVGTYYVQLDFL